MWKLFTICMKNLSEGKKGAEKCLLSGWGAKREICNVGDDVWDKKLVQSVSFYILIINSWTCVRGFCQIIAQNCIWTF